MRAYQITNLIVLTLSLCFVASSLNAMIFGQNDYKPADDIDLKSDSSLDEEIKSLINRVVQVKTPDDFYASAFLFGQTCSNIVTAKHNFYDKSTGKRYFSGDHIINYNNNNVVIDAVEESITQWVIRDEGIIFPLSQGIKNLNCPNIPVITSENIEKFNDCLIVGYPEQQVIVDNKKLGSTGKSAIKQNSGSLYDADKRGYARCQIKENIEGKVIHDCDSTGGTSGGPIFCRVNDKWSYVSVNNGGACIFNGKKDLAKCHDVDGGHDYLVQDKSNRIYGSGGSFSYDFME